MVKNNLSILLIIISLLFTSIVAAEVSSSIDRNPVRVNETFELTLHMETAPVSKPPLEGLPKELEIIRSSNFYQRSTVNGQTEVQAGWRFTLKAIKEGIFTIPAFEVDGKQTAPLQVKVLAPVSSTRIGGQENAIQLKASVDLQDVYIQQQILYTIRLYRAVQAQYASLTEPDMPGALLERLGEDKQFETEIDGVRYIVLERRYVIFPQESGLQEISPVIFTAEVSDGARRYSTLGRFQPRTKAVSLSTESIKINVKRQPEITGSWWLPATNVSLIEKWQPEPTEFRVGKPVTWSYTIEASGLTATQLPELLPADVDGLKFYPDTALSTNQSDQDGITGSRTQKVAVVPARAGPLALPELKISWWDVKQNISREITLPSRTIEVLPDLDNNHGQQPVIETSVETSTQEPVRAEKAPSSDNEQPLSQESELDDHAWKIIALMSLLLWIITALFMFLRKTLSTGYIEQKQQKEKAGISTTTLAKMQRACKNNSAKATREAILSWCADQQEFSDVHSLSKLSAMVSDEELSQQLKLLEKHLYAADQGQWQGAALLPLLKKLRIGTVKTLSENKQQLPPLHPE